MKGTGYSKLLCWVFAPLLVVLFISLLFTNPVIATVNYSNIDYTLYTSATSDDVWENEATITTNAQPGMVADDPVYNIKSQIYNRYDIGSIITSGNFAHGMVAEGYDSEATNEGSILTTGFTSHGMMASNDSYSENSETGTIVTDGSYSYGMFATGSSEAFNYGDIETNGTGSHGMAAESGSGAVNDGEISTYGSNASGCTPWTQL